MLKFYEAKIDKIVEEMDQAKVEYLNTEMGKNRCSLRTATL